MYLFDHAYPAAKQLLNSRFSVKSMIDDALSVCRKHCRHPYWDEVEKLDFAAEHEQIRNFWKALLKSPPPSETSVLWIAPHDIPTRFNLRGASKWSQNENDWDWFYHDDYDGPTHDSPLIKKAMFAENDESLTPGKGPGKSPYDVIEMYFSLVVFAVFSIDAVRQADIGKGILGRRASQTIVIGHPDSVHGIILGKRTKTRWQRYVTTSI